VPVMVHVNYHPDKFERLQSVWKKYVEGDAHALDHYPIGEWRQPSAYSCGASHPHTAAAQAIRIQQQTASWLSVDHGLSRTAGHW
jgi:hypothetical protein